MDEVRIVRDAYPEPRPPTAGEVERARALLASPPRRARPRLAWGLGGVLAAGAAATAAVVLVGGSTSPAPGGPVTLDGRAAVLAAAEQAAQRPTGKYWYTNDVDGQAYVVRAKTGTYAITGALSEAFQWTGATSGSGSASYSRDLPARPTTARDAELWRAAGSPRRLRVWSSDKFLTFPMKATGAGTKWDVDTDARGGGTFLDGLTAADVRNLPTDPAELAKRYLSDEAAARRASGLRGDDPGAVKPGPVRPQMRMSLAKLVLNAPLPPKVRAGVMRALAAQPGIHAIGRTTDPLGRRGVALATDDWAVTVTGESGEPRATQGTYRVRDVLVFDERTGALLAKQEVLTRPGGPYTGMKPGFVVNYSAVRAMDWSDARPTTPTTPPFG
ncbi:CU044_5270 family protein [Actinomadura atramentaria]|uniref:CU044_5270 family protein n=1 Tax=Actinomadura atramentaria TaxID=1990 RepID=UPI00036BDF2F|nr:CU044_5270 family protein [Actinomadura atramentaria]